jgi:hypothetical protein
LNNASRLINKTRSVGALLNVSLGTFAAGGGPGSVIITWPNQ